MSMDLLYLEVPHHRRALRDWGSLFHGHTDSRFDEEKPAKQQIRVYLHMPNTPESGEHWVTVVSRRLRAGR
jgi:hypothetical protein